MQHLCAVACDSSQALQVLMLAPTREIAMQIRDVVRDIGAFLGEEAADSLGLRCHVFIGGMPLAEEPTLTVFPVLTPNPFRRM
jgi:superfamily II DNA/RNA helicase